MRIVDAIPYDKTIPAVEAPESEVVAEVVGLVPGKYGFLIHALGDCSAEDGTSAGGHFNPEEKPTGNAGARAACGVIGIVERQKR